MGNDGGSIPRRSELVKTKQKVSATTKTAVGRFCALSREPLAPPIVVCSRGLLYNKESILQLLIDRSVFGDADVLVPHIRSLKDVVQASISTLAQTDKSTFVCPITQKEFTEKTKFICIASCGCVVAHQAITQLASSESPTCLVCSAPFSPKTDIIIINPSSQEDVDANAARAALVKQKESDRKRLKKSKKSKSDQPATESSSEQVSAKTKRKERTESSDPPKRPPPSQPSINLPLPGVASAIKAVSSSSAPVSEAVQSLYVKKDKDGKPIQEETSFLVRGTFNRFAAGF